MLGFIVVVIVVVVVVIVDCKAVDAKNRETT